MEDFDFISPTRIIFGQNKEESVGSILKSYNAKRVLLLYGGGSIIKTGLYDKVTKSLKESHIDFVPCGGVRPNPEIEFVRSAIKTALDNEIDFILAVGGGSVIDTAKSIGVGCHYDGDPFDFNLKKAIPNKTFPVGVILTMASAGSESSNSCVIQNDELGIKQGFNNDIVRPVFAIENPKITYTVPSYQVFAGVSDIMMHSLERYFGQGQDDLLSDQWALDLIASTMKAGKAIQNNPEDYQARSTIMVNSSLSHDGLTGLGKKVAFAVHPLEHALSGYKPSIVHGAGVALLFPAWAKYVYKNDIDKFARMSTCLFGKKSANKEETAIMGIDAIRDYFVSIGMPSTLEEVGLGETDIPKVVALATGNGTRVVGRYPQPLTYKDVEAIYRSLLGGKSK